MIALFVILVSQIAPLPTTQPPAISSLETNQTPLKSAQPTLYAAPEGDSPRLREIGADDKVEVLRTHTGWAEVELTTPEGLRFQGWIPIATTPSPSISPLSTQRTKPQPLQKKPLDFGRWKFVWSPDIAERVEFQLTTGLQTIEYHLTGLVDDTPTTIYKYAFHGVDIEPQLRLTLARWKELSIDFATRYCLGLYSLEFSSQEVVTELRGRAYSIMTHDIEALLRTGWSFRWRDLRLHPRIGLGYKIFNIRPDLDPISSGDLQGETPFGDTTLTTLLNEISIDASYRDTWGLMLAASPYLAFRSLKDIAARSDHFSVSGLPLSIQSRAFWRFSDPWSLVLQANWFKVSGNQKAESPTNAEFERLGKDYTQGKLALNVWRINLGVSARF